MATTPTPTPTSVPGTRIVPPRIRSSPFRYALQVPAQGRGRGSGRGRANHATPGSRARSTSARLGRAADARGTSSGAAPHRRDRRVAAAETRARSARRRANRSEEHTSELQSLRHLVCRLLLEKKKKNHNAHDKET